MWPLRRGMIAGRGALDSSAVAWTPADLSPTVWIEPGKGGLFQTIDGTTTAATADTHAVGYAPDHSGNSFHLTAAANDTTRPTLNGVGVFPYLSFDGTNDILRRLASTGAYAAGAATWYVAIRSNSNAVSSIVVGERDSAATPSNYSFLMASSATATSAAAFVRNSANTTIHIQSTAVQTSVFNGSDHVYGVYDSSTQFTPYLDGVAGAAVNYTTARGGTLTQNTFGLGGALTTTPGSFWAGRVYGLVCVNRVLTAPERASLTTYLGNLMGMSL